MTKSLTNSTDSRQHIRGVLEDPNTSATVLLVLLMDFYPPRPEENTAEFLNWAPQSIRHQLSDDFGARISDATIGRIMAGIHLITSDEFYHNLPTFNDLCVVLAGEPHRIDMFVPASAAACAWGITEALLLSPPDQNDKEPFDDEIRAYISKALHDEGILTAPDILRIALHDPKLADKVRYDFADDPEMFGAIFESEASKTDDINRFVKGRLRQTLETLESLPLRRGNVEQLAAKMLANLPAAHSS